MSQPSDYLILWKWVKCTCIKLCCVCICEVHNDTDISTRAKIINVFRAWIGAQLTICAQK